MALHRCIFLDSDNDAGVVAALVDRGADPNARNQQGDMPLHNLVLMDNPSIIAALLDAGAEPNSRTDNNFYASTYSRRQQQSRRDPACC